MLECNALDPYILNRLLIRSLEHDQLTQPRRDHLELVDRFALTWHVMQLTLGSIEGPLTRRIEQLNCILDKVPRMRFKPTNRKEWTIRANRRCELVSVPRRIN